jgi:hypothetical protein
MTQAIILILILIVAAFWLFRAKRRQVDATTTTVTQTQPPYHCVEIRSRNDPCEAAKNLAGTRYLSDEAPRLPVPGCSAQECACRYVHHDDRRHELRRNPYGLWATITSAETGERRSRKDRRVSADTVFRPSIAR